MLETIEPGVETCNSRAKKIVITNLFNINPKIYVANKSFGKWQNIIGTCCEDFLGFGS